MSEESKEYRQSPRVAHPFMVRYRVAADWQGAWGGCAVGGVHA